MGPLWFPYGVLDGAHMAHVGQAICDELLKKKDKFSEQKELFQTEDLFKDTCIPNLTYPQVSFSKALRDAFGMVPSSLS